MRGGIERQTDREFIEINVNISSGLLHQADVIRLILSYVVEICIELSIHNNNLTSSFTSNLTFSEIKQLINLIYVFYFRIQ